MNRISFPRSFAFAAFLALASGGCTCSEDMGVGKGQAKEQKPVTAAPTAAPTAVASAPPSSSMPKGSLMPMGPRLIVDPGQGLGAIRFGATFETVERHMGASCEIKTESKCVYVRQAVEFDFKDGVVSGIRAHRRDRQVSEAAQPQYYGTFRGILFPSIMLGLFRHVVIEEFGEPQKVEPLSGPDGQVERHTYDGLIFEYDQLENGNVVLAAIEVVPSKTAKPGPQFKSGDPNVADSKATAPAAPKDAASPSQP